MKNSLLKLENNRAKLLNRIVIASGTEYDEKWLQNIIINNPSILLNNELFDDEILIPVGDEISIEPRSRIDILFVTNKGRVIIVETKLWKNPEIQREVIAQVIDYAKCIHQWSIEDFEENIRINLRKNNVKFENVGKYIEEKFFAPNNINEKYIDFLERLSDCIEHGNFLLLIAGDKIAPNLILLRDSIRGNENLAFQIGLMELQIYKDNEEIIISPDVVGITTIETRAVIRIQYENEKPNLVVNQQIEEEPKENHKTGKTNKIEFLKMIPSDLQSVLDEYLKKWENNDKIILSWGQAGTGGCVLKIIEKEKPTTVIEFYSDRFHLINEKMAAQFDNYKNGYLSFVENIKQNDILSNLYIQNKVRIKYEKVDADALSVVFNATNEFINYLLNR
ncbi:MAG: hypothetical protein Ta2B_18240 [Termitinemataceae bacterium]|nr:MAG: hypothetical protein Ta2B_18240 [Termitinemataceae bacterium]